MVRSDEPMETVTDADTKRCYLMERRP